MTESTKYIDDKTRRRLRVHQLADTWCLFWHIPGTDAQEPTGDEFVLTDELPVGTPSKQVVAELERRCYEEAQKRGITIAGLKISTTPSSTG